MVLKRDHLISHVMPTVPREKYPEMNFRAAITKGDTVVRAFKLANERDFPDRPGLLHQCLSDPSFFFAFT